MPIIDYFPKTVILNGEYDLYIIDHVGVIIKDEINKLIGKVKLYYFAEDFLDPYDSKWLIWLDIDKIDIKIRCNVYHYSVKLSKDNITYILPKVKFQRRYDTLFLVCSYADKNKMTVAYKIMDD